MQRQIAAWANSASADLDPLPWAGYATVHQQIRKLDNGGNWDGAVALATGTAAGHRQRHVRSFDTSSDRSSPRWASRPPPSSTTPAAGWRSPRSRALLAGIVAALSAWWGVSLRLEEYR